MLDMKDKEIGGISINTWRKAFAEAVNIAIEKDYFTDIIEYKLYTNTNTPWGQIWQEVDEAFKEVFGFFREEIN